jgi:hypothetical protein
MGSKNVDEQENNKKRIPGEGDVISGGNLSSGCKFVVDFFSDEIPGVRVLSIYKLSSDGTYDPVSKKEEICIVYDRSKTIDGENLVFHNKMKKKFVKKKE